MSRGNSVSKITVCGIEDQGSITGRGKHFSLLHCGYSSSGSLSLLSNSYMRLFWR
jgi:hypothetical protein